jgi:hypothetical protein
MKRKKVMLKKKRTPSVPTATADPIRSQHGPEPRVKTSVIITQSIHAKAQERARVSGISYNGLINLALYSFLESTNGHASGGLPPEISAIVTNRPPRPPRQERRRADATEVFTRPRLSEDEPAISVTYGQAQSIWEMQGQHPDEDYSKIAKRCGVTTEMVLAAEAAQDDQAFQRWAATVIPVRKLRLKKKRQVARG